MSDQQSNAEYESSLAAVPGLLDLARESGNGQFEAPLAAELILEGLNQHLKLRREDLDSTVTYREMLKFQILRRRPQAVDDGDLN